MRFANLSNNAQLELRKLSGPRPDGEVTVAVSTESGDRKTGRFISSTTLWDVISQTTGIPKLKKGHLIVCIYMRKEVMGEDNLKATTIRNLGLTCGNAVLRVTTREIDALGQAHVENLKLKKPASGQESQVEQTVTQVKESVSKFGKNLKKMASGLFENKSTDEANPPAAPPKIPIKTFGGEGRTLAPSSTSTAPVTSPPIPQNVDNDHNLEVNWLSTERDALVFRLDDISKMNPYHGESNQDLPDDFFEVTRDDVLYMLQDLKRQVVDMDNRPLETKALREKRLKETKYSRSVIRICFPGDGLVIQATFQPNETIATVIEFVNQFLFDPTEGFYLYTTPPKAVLKPSDTLLDKKLVPAAMIHFGNASNANSPVLNPDIRAKITSFKAIAETTRRLRDKVDLAGEGNSQCLPQVCASSADQLVESSEPSINQGSKVTKTDPSKVPKWFKMSK